MEDIDDPSTTTIGQAVMPPHCLKPHEYNQRWLLSGLSKNDPWMSNASTQRLFGIRVGRLLLPGIPASEQQSTDLKETRPCSFCGKRFRAPGSCGHFTLFAGWVCDLNIAMYGAYASEISCDCSNMEPYGKSADARWSAEETLAKIMRGRYDPCDGFLLLWLSKLAEMLVKPAISREPPVWDPV
jgi:hypothetical protein